MKREPSLSHFTAELECWAQRLPERSAGAARGRVLARLRNRPQGLRWKIPAAAVILLALALGFSSVLSRVGRPPEVTEHPGQSLIVFQLQSGTKIYFALPPEGATKGDSP
jgi:hypothetical protein